MAAASIALTKIPLNGGVALPTMTALTADGAQVAFDEQDGKTVILIQNTNTAAADVTFVKGNGIQGVADVGFDTVLFIENGSDASLGIVGGPLTQGSLAQYHHPSVVSKTQCEGEAGGTTANDKNITTVFNVLLHKYHWLGWERPMLAQFADSMQPGSRFFA